MKITLIVILTIIFVVILESCCKKKTLPIVITENITEITPTSAVSGGDVTNNGGAEVTVRGVCWSSAPNPTIDSNPNKTTDGTGNGPFESTITNLSPNTTYFVCAYASNSEGTGYGNQVSFTTPPGIPVASFTASSTTITAGQSVQFTDQSTNNPISWIWNFGDGSTSTQQNPSHSYTNAGTYTVSLTVTNSTGSNKVTKEDYITVNPIVEIPVAAFTASQTQITVGQSVQFTDQSVNNPTSWSWDFGDGGSSSQQNPSHTYNSAGIYTITLAVTNMAGSDIETKVSYIAVNAFIDNRDNHEYHWVQIGDQIWMAENLAYLPSVNPPSVYSYTESYYYVYGYEGTSVSAAKATTNFSTYGVLYNWPAAMAGQAGSYSNPSGVQGVCPSGWHLPSDEEWKQLEMFLGMNQEQVDSITHRGTIEGGKLKETGTSHWQSPNTGATDEYGFTALPAGMRNEYSSFYGLNEKCYWWTSSQSEDYDVSAYHRDLVTLYSTIYRWYYYKELGFSVRCIKD